MAAPTATRLLARGVLRFRPEGPDIAAKLAKQVELLPDGLTELAKLRNESRDARSMFCALRRQGLLKMRRPAFGRLDGARLRFDVRLQVAEVRRRQQVRVAQVHFTSMPCVPQYVEVGSCSL